MTGHQESVEQQAKKRKQRVQGSTGYICALLVVVEYVIYFFGIIIQLYDHHLKVTNEKRQVFEIDSGVHV